MYRTGALGVAMIYRASVKSNDPGVPTHASRFIRTSRLLLMSITRLTISNGIGAGAGRYRVPSA